MSPFIDALLFTWRKNGKRAQDLLANLPDDRLTRQTHGLKNHPAWCFSHLMLYHPAVCSMARGEAVTDPALSPDVRHYINGSIPVDDPALYPTRMQLMERFSAGHAQVEEAVAAMDPARFAAPPGLERWNVHFQTVGNTLAYMMLYHESHHLAEVADWKKVQGLTLI